jgi:cytochrome c
VSIIPSATPPGGGGRRVRGLAFVAVAAAGLGSSPAARADGHEQEPPAAFDPCLSCHAYEPDDAPLEGPSLWQVYGRPIASLPGFEYSPALARIEGRWDRATLERFLAAPQAFAPGTLMTLGGVRNAADRAAILDFLATLQ